MRPIPSGNATSRSATKRSATCWWRRETGLGRWPPTARASSIREALAVRNPANTQWQVDVAVSCAKLGALEYGQSIEERRGYLLRGREILVRLKSDGRLMPNQDWIASFDEELAK